MTDDWRDRAACKGADPELFYPGLGEDSRKPKQVCAGCDVRQECLDYAIANQEMFGIWGGKSERERRKIRASVRNDITIAARGGARTQVRTRPAQCGTNGGYYAHRRLGTDPCQPCRDAHAEAERERTAHEPLNGSRLDAGWRERLAGPEVA